MFRLCPDGSLKHPSNNGGDHPVSLGNLCYCLTPMPWGGFFPPLASSCFNLCLLYGLLTKDRRSNGEINSAGTTAEGAESPLRPGAGGGSAPWRAAGRPAGRDGDTLGSGLPPTPGHPFPYNSLTPRDFHSSFLAPSKSSFKHFSLLKSGGGILSQVHTVIYGFVCVFSKYTSCMQ